MRPESLCAARRLSLYAADWLTLRTPTGSSRTAKRGFSTKIFDFGKVEPAAKGTVRQTAKLRQGINQELAKSITKLVRDKFPKLKTQIQGDAVRVSGASKDMLQGSMKLLREQDYPVPLQFNNYR